MVIIQPAMLPIPQAHQPARFGFFAAAPGTTSPGVAGLRTATGTPRLFATPALGFVL